MLLSLAKKHALSRHSSGGKFTRHGVMHGQDVGYGTKVNFLRALSLLGSIEWVIGAVVREPDEHEQ